MYRFALGIALLAGMVPGFGQNQDSQSPVISLVLPPGIASETLQIEYFMSGPFGGYGSFIKAGKDLTAYKIHASVDGRPATNVKLIAYLPGCRIVTLDIAVSRTTPEQPLECQPLGTLPLHGQLVPASMTQNQTVEIEVSYLALWSHQFFGVWDWPVTTIHIGTVIPDQNGQFQVELPDL